MRDEKIKKYHEMLEELLCALNNSDGEDMTAIKKLLANICEFFGVSKGFTEFYRSLTHEKTGRGEVLVAYDNGKGGEPIASCRIVTKSMTVVKCSAFRPTELPPLDDEAIKKIDLTMKVLLSFVSRVRLQNVVESFAFNDDAGYPNIRAFMRYLEKLNEKNELGGCDAARFNLRHFTLVNQEIGRNFGDVAMRNFFNHLKDLVGNDGVVCRIGGDNFVAIFNDSVLVDFLETLKGIPVVYDVNSGRRVMISASAGIFRIPPDFHFETTDEIMDRIVPCAMAAKNGGNDSIVFYDEKTFADKDKQMRVQHLFPIALDKEEFKVYYQPKIDIATGEIIGAEALCRWLYEGKIVPPLEFIPILEQNSDICKLDFYMLDRVCRDIRRWLDEKRKVVRVSVNLSRKHMMDIDLLQHILDIVDAHRVPHQYIEIELTETTTDVEFRDLKRVVSGLQQAGVYTSVDDFGMGYSSLNLIREIPWNVLKVDRSFLPIENDNSDSTRSVMFKYVVAMAKELGLECIAEGVETQKQVEILRDNNCLYAQGFFFDKPLPLDEFERRLDKKRYNVQSGALEN